MNVILALCLLALAPLTPWGRSVDARAAPILHVAASESWEFEESTESQEDGLDQGSLTRKHDLAELLLPYIQRELTESRPLISKKNAKIAHVNSRKKHVVEITPLRGKGRDGKPLAYILAPAKADLRRALAKRIDKHHVAHENQNHDSYRAHKKSLIESSSEEDSSEEVTIKAGKLIPFGESKELVASADVSKETVMFDKTTALKESKQPSSSKVASEEENVVSGKLTSIKEETESDSSEDYSKYGSINSDTSTLLEEPEKSSLNKDADEERSDKSVSLTESANLVSKDNANEVSVKSDKSVSIEEPSESLSSKDDSENIVKLDKTPSFTETEESGSINDVQEEEPVNLDKLISFEESKQSSSSANNTKEDTAPIIERKEYSSNEGDSEEETGKSDNATLLDQPSESRSREDVTEVKIVKLDSVENSTSVEEPIISKFSTDQTDNTVHESFKDGSSSGQTSDSEESVVENEGSNDGFNDSISYKQDTDVNVSVSGKLSSADDSSDLENYDTQQDTETQLSAEKSTKNQLNSKSLHKSHDEKQHVSHSHNVRSSSEINTEENLAGSKNIEKNETQQTQYIQIKKSESILNEKSTNAYQDKNELHVKIHTDKNQKDQDEVKYEDKVHLRNHYNHRNHEHHHRDHNISDSAENVKLFEKRPLQKSHKDENSADKHGIAVNDEINDTIPVENVNELQDKPDEANSESKNETETNTSEINEDKAAKKIEGEKTNIKIEDETQVDKHSEEISQNDDLEQPKSEISIAINENEVSESEKSVENTEEEGKLEILTPSNEVVESNVEKTTEITTIEVPNEQSKIGQQAEENKLEEPTEHAHTIELVRDGDNLTEKNNTSKTNTNNEIRNPVEINKTEPVVEESKSESLIENSKPSEPVADSEIGSETGNTEEDSKKENSLEESKIEAGEENNIDKVADKEESLEERTGNAEKQSSVSAKPCKNKIVKIKKLFDKSSVEDSETILTHSRLRTVSSKLPNNGIIITQQDGLNNIWKPDSQNDIEVIQSPPCQARGEGPSDRAPHEHKSYRLSFLFNK